MDEFPQKLQCPPVIKGTESLAHLLICPMSVSYEETYRARKQQFLPQEQDLL